MPASRAIRAAVPNAPVMSAISPAVSAWGSTAPGWNAIGLGPTGTQPPSCGAIGLLPSHVGVVLGLRPGELDAGHRAAAADDCSEPRQQRLMLRLPQAEAVGRDAADCGDVRPFGEHDAGAAHRTRAEMLHVPVITQAIDRGILAHRRHHDAVARGDGTETDRLEQKRCCHAGHGPCGCVAAQYRNDRVLCQSTSGAMPFSASSRRALSVLSSTRPMPRMTCGALVNWMSL